MSLNKGQRFGKLNQSIKSKLFKRKLIRERIEFESQILRPYLSTLDIHSIKSFKIYSLPTINS